MYSIFGCNKFKTKKNTDANVILFDQHLMCKFCVYCVCCRHTFFFSASACEIKKNPFVANGILAFK